MVETPFDKLKKLLSKEIPSELISKLPDKWEKIGDIVIIRLPAELTRYKTRIGEEYAEVLGCKTMLRDMGGISGVYREPNVEIIYGTRDTETVHKENGIRYKLDPQKIMFSSRNMDERIRMASVSNNDEIVVDLFAGIGYFTLPVAVYSKPKKIFACEINPVAYGYLCENIVLNDVTLTVEPLLGDNRETVPEDVADRVIIGYINDTCTFLPLAIDCLKNNAGVLHYHEVCSNELLPSLPLNHVKEAAEKYDKNVHLLKYRHIKSYAPGVSHVVLDILVG